MICSIRQWSDEADVRLQDCFASTDWDMFRDSSDCNEEFTTILTGFIKKCIDNVIPAVTIRTYPIQKPWITGNIHTGLKARATAYKEWDKDVFKTSDLRDIKRAKGQYRRKVKSYYTGSNVRCMWLGLHSITDYKGKPSHKFCVTGQLLYSLYARFEEYNSLPCVECPCFSRMTMSSLSVADL